MFHQKAFAGVPARMRPRRRRKGWMTGWSPRKIVRVAIVLLMSFLCWMGIGCFAFEMLQLAGR
jgi:hypothetical protein